MAVAYINSCVQFAATSCRRKVQDYSGAGFSAILADSAKGMAVGMVLWPVALGNAEIAGVPPSVAIGTAVLPSILYAFMGSLPLLSIQAGSTIALCLAELTADSEALGLTPTQMAGLQSVLVGVFQLILGFLDLAFITEIFSHPLLRGRTVAMSTLVVISTMKKLMGLKLTESSKIPLVQLAYQCMAIKTAHKVTCITSAVLIVVLYSMRWGSKNLAASVATKKIATSEPAQSASKSSLSTAASPSGRSPAGSSSPSHLAPVFSGTPIPMEIGVRRVSESSLSESDRSHDSSSRSRSGLPGPLTKPPPWVGTRSVVAQVLGISSSIMCACLAIIIQRTVGNGELTPIATVELPTYTPNIVMPKWDAMRELVPSAMLMGFLSLGSHLTVAERIRRPQDHVDARQELVATGCASMMSSVVGGMPPMPNLAVSQSIRTCTGVVGNLANAIGHLAAFYIAASCEPIREMPACAISSIIFIEFAPILLEAPKELCHLYRQMKHSRGEDNWSWGGLLSSDLAIYLAAIVSPLLLGVIQGSVLAIALELLFAVTRFAGAGYVELGRVQGTFEAYDELGVPGSNAEELSGIAIVRFSCPRWFGNCVSTTRIARKERQKSGKVILAVVVDTSMVAFFDETALHHYKREWTRKLPYRVFVTGCCATVRRQLQTAGIAELLGQPGDSLVQLHSAVRLAEAHVQSERSAELAMKDPDVTIEPDDIQPEMRSRRASNVDVSPPPTGSRQLQSDRFMPERPSMSSDRLS